MGQFSFMGYPCPQCSTCRYYKYDETGYDGRKSSIPHACTNQTTRSNAYELYGKNECQYGYGTTNPCQTYESNSESSSEKKPLTKEEIIRMKKSDIKSTFIGAIIGAVIGIVICLLAMKDSDFSVVSMIVILFGIWAGLGVGGNMTNVVIGIFEVGFFFLLIIVPLMLIGSVIAGPIWPLIRILILKKELKEVS